MRRRRAHALHVSRHAQQRQRQRRAQKRHQLHVHNREDGVEREEDDQRGPDHAPRF